MATDASNSISWLLELQQEHIDWLAPIRHWSHLSIATDEGTVWVKGFKEQEINSVTVKSLPVKKIWYQNGPLLFRQGSNLPSRNLPSLLWSPVERGLPLELPLQNHHYFGVDAQVQIKLVPGFTEHPAAAMIMPLPGLKSFIETAPAIRLINMVWAIIGAEQALVIGTPLLPVPGAAYWMDGNFLLPAGYDFEWPALRETIRRKIGSSDTHMIIWQQQAVHLLLPKAALKPLTIGSFRQSETLWKLKAQVL